MGEEAGELAAGRGLDAAAEQGASGGGGSRGRGRGAEAGSGLGVGASARRSARSRQRAAEQPLEERQAQQLAWEKCAASWGNWEPGISKYTGVEGLLYKGSEYFRLTSERCGTLGWPSRLPIARDTHQCEIHVIEEVGGKHRGWNGSMRVRWGDRLVLAFGWVTVPGEGPESLSPCVRQNAVPPTNLCADAAWLWRRTSRRAAGPCS